MARGVRITTPPEQLVAAYGEGLGVRAVAVRFGMSYGTAYNRLKAAGVLRRWGGGRRRAA